MSKLTKSFIKSRDGNFATIFALLAFVLAGSASFGVTYTTISHERSELQDNLDASVLAGMSLGYSATDQQRVAAAIAMMSQRTLKFGSSQEASFSVNADTSQFRVFNYTLIGEAKTEVSGLFADLMGNNITTLSVKAVAEKSSTEPVCIHALNPRSAGSIQLYGSASLKSNCVVMADSENPTGIMTWGNTTSAEAKSFGVTGSFKGNFNPTPRIDVFPLKDQYADLPIPRPGACVDVASKLMHVEVELDPGTYCGGLTISPDSVVTLRPGVHIFNDGPLNISANSTLKGEEVVIALVGDNAVINANSGSTMNLTSPVSGEYTNIQFISDRELNGSVYNEEWTTLSSTSLIYDGLMYLPEQGLWLKGGSNIEGRSPTMAMVADQIWVQDDTTMKIVQENARSIKLDDKGAGYRYSARLVE